MAAKRGGKRPGAGRPAGAKSRATKDAKATLSDLAKQYAPLALEKLAKIAAKGESESAVVAACNSLLDRGYGKPPQFNTADLDEFRRATDLTDDQLDKRISELARAVGLETGAAGSAGGEAATRKPAGAGPVPPLH